MRRILLLAVFAALALAIYAGAGSDRAAPVATPPTRTSERSPATPPGEDAALAGAIAQHARDVRVQDQGIVERVLADDRDGSPHQRFVLRLHSGTSVLVAHNVELAPRVSPLRRGDTIAFAGEYIWNDRGGVVHWTHHDPARHHPGGWLRREGVVFE